MPRFFYSISKTSLSCLFGRTNESKIPTMAGTNHGSDALAKGRALTRFARNSTLNELPNTLAMAMAVTTAIVNCIPGFERATNLLTMTIITIAMVIGYKITNTGIEYLIIASRPKLAMANPIKVKAVA